MKHNVDKTLKLFFYAFFVSNQKQDIIKRQRNFSKLCALCVLCGCFITLRKKSAAARGSWTAALGEVTRRLYILYHNFKMMSRGKLVKIDKYNFR